MKAFPCHLYMLYQNEKGEIYPCPRANKSHLIGRITEIDIIKKILYFQPPHCECSICELRAATTEERERGIINTNLEIGGECNGACVYCFQKTLSTFRQHYPYYQELFSFYKALDKLEYTTVFGGEVSFQPSTLDLIAMIKREHNTNVSIVTNGFIPFEKFGCICENVDSFQVSFNGFSKKSMYYISKIDIEVVKSFCEYLSRKNEKNLDVKLLVSPLSVGDIVDFLEWSLSINVSHVMIYYAIIPSPDYEENGNREVSSLDHMIPGYWDEILYRINADFQQFFKVHYAEIIQRGVNYIINKEILKLLKLPEDYLEKLNIPSNRSISITCKAWAEFISKYNGD